MVSQLGGESRSQEVHVNKGIKIHLSNHISSPVKFYIFRRGFVYIFRRELVVVKEGSQAWDLNEHFVEFAQLSEAARECIAENCLANFVKLPINETDSNNRNYKSSYSNPQSPILNFVWRHAIPP